MYRNEIDWVRLLAEGAKIPLDGVVPGISGITVLIAPLNPKQDLLAILVPLEKDHVTAVRDNLQDTGAMVKRYEPVITSLVRLLARG